MIKKLITTIPMTRALGMECRDCPLAGQGMNQKQFCSFYKKSHDSARPQFCKVRTIDVTEDGEQPEISSLEVHELCHDLLYARGIYGTIHRETEDKIIAWLEGKRITVKK